MGSNGNRTDRNRRNRRRFLLLIIVNVSDGSHLAVEIQCFATVPALTGQVGPTRSAPLGCLLGRGFNLRRTRVPCPRVLHHHVRSRHLLVESVDGISVPADRPRV